MVSKKVKVNKLWRKTYLVFVVIILLFCGGVFALTRPNNSPAQVDTPSQPSAKAVQKPEASTPTPTQGQTSPTQSLPVISKPMLSKSSGNNGPVPAKTNIEFSCMGVVDANCYIILSNKDNPSDSLKFDAKTITDDGRGNTSVTWIWESKPGTWTVKATQSASGHQPSTSDAQTLTVNP